jgi:hypothetical protein
MRFPRSSLIALMAAAAPLAAQSKPNRTEVSGVPALNFDADEGFGYGAILAITQYGPAGVPYRFSLQPTVFLTTEGRRDITLFLDAPAVLPYGWRVSAFAGREQQLATPFYGIGNDTRYDPNVEKGSTRYFYRYGRDRYRASADFQHRLGSGPVRVLLGAGASRDEIDLTPFDSGTTLVQKEIGTPPPAAVRPSFRGGLIWDSRDQEIGTTSGTWASALVERVSRGNFAAGYERFTGTYRIYVPVSDRVTFAQRLIGQHLRGSAPFYDLATIQTEFKPQEGLGGSGSIRGLPKNRYVGKAIALSNSELRWKAADFTRHGRQSTLVLSSFLDAGRVWASSAASDIYGNGEGGGIHAGYGGGARLGFGSTFVVALDVAHSSQSTAPIYIGLGYMF